MKTAYFFVLFLTVTVPDHTDSWFFHSVRRIRFGAYHTLGCKAACNWAQSWACKVCKRFSEFDTSGEADPLEDFDLRTDLHDLDVNGDGWVEPSEIAHVTGLRVTNPVLFTKFYLADKNADSKLDKDEVKEFHFDTKEEVLEALADDADDP